MPRHPAFPNLGSLLYCDPADSRRATPFAVGWRPFGAHGPYSDQIFLRLRCSPSPEGEGRGEVGYEKWSVPTQTRDEVRMIFFNIAHIAT